MSERATLQRFLDAQENDYAQALAEIKRGHKESHWMWYIFPQIAGLGSSETAQFYAIRDLDEAKAYLAHPLLGKRLVEIAQALLTTEGKTANEILGSPDDLKLKSSMTLFSAIAEADSVFEQVLKKFYAGTRDQRTLAIIGTTD